MTRISPGQPTPFTCQRIIAHSAPKGWRPPVPGLPVDAVRLLHQPAPLPFALAADGHPTHVSVRDQQRIAGAAHDVALLRQPAGSPLVRHTELVHHTTGQLAGYTEARWHTDTATDAFTTTAHRYGLADAIHLHHHTATIELLWWGCWTPAARTMLARTWLLYQPRRPLAVVIDATAGIDPPPPRRRPPASQPSPARRRAQSHRLPAPAGARIGSC